MNIDGPGHLLPPIDALRDVAQTIACAVAEKAREEHLCDVFQDESLNAMIEENMCAAAYRRYDRE